MPRSSFVSIIYLLHPPARGLGSLFAANESARESKSRDSHVSEGVNGVGLRVRRGIRGGRAPAGRGTAAASKVPEDPRCSSARDEWTLNLSPMSAPFLPSPWPFAPGNWHQSRPWRQQTRLLPRAVEALGMATTALFHSGAWRANCTKKMNNSDQNAQYSCLCVCACVCV